MRKRIKALVVVSILLVILADSRIAEATGPRFTPQMFEDEDKIQIVAYEYPPLTTLEIASMGLVTEVVQASFKEADMEVTIEIQVLKDLAKYYLLQDNAIAMMGQKQDFSEEEQKQLVIIPCCIMTGYYFYYKPAHKDLQWGGKPENLKGYTYGALKDEDVKDYEKTGIKIVRADDIISLIKKLHAKEIDFMSASEVVGGWLIKENFPKETDNFVRMKTPAWGSAFSIIFNKTHPRAEEVRNAFIRGFEAIRKSRGYLQILEKYYGKGNIPEDYMKRLKNLQK